MSSTCSYLRLIDKNSIFFKEKTEANNKTVGLFIKKGCHVSNFHPGSVLPFFKINQRAGFASVLNPQVEHDGSH